MLNCLWFSQLSLFQRTKLPQIPPARKSRRNLSVAEKLIVLAGLLDSREFIRQGERNEAGWEQLSLAHGLDQAKTVLVGSEPPCPARQRTSMSTQPSRIARPQSRYLRGMSTEPFVSADEAASFLAIKRRYLLALARNGIAGAYALGTGTVRKVWVFRLSELAAAIAGKKTDPKMRELCDPASGSPR